MIGIEEGEDSQLKGPNPNLVQWKLPGIYVGDPNETLSNGGHRVSNAYLSQLCEASSGRMGCIQLRLAKRVLWKFPNNPGWC